MAEEVSIRLSMKKGWRSVIGNSGPAMDACTQVAEEVKGRADSTGSATYGIKSARPGKNRCHAFVYTPDRHAMNSNAKHNTLVKAIR